MVKFQIGETVKHKYDERLRRIVGITNDKYIVRSHNVGDNRENFELRVGYVHDNYDFYMKKVKSTNISRTFYKNRIRKEEEGYLWINLYY